MVEEASRCPASPRLLDAVQRVERRRINGLHPARWPGNDRAIHLRHRPDAEVKPAIVLRAEAAAAADFLRLLVTVPVQLHPCADGAAVAGRAFELERDPMPARRDAIPVEVQRPVL